MRTRARQQHAHTAAGNTMFSKRIVVVTVVVGAILALGSAWSALQRRGSNTGVPYLAPVTRQPRTFAHDRQGYHHGSATVMAHAVCSHRAGFGNVLSPVTDAEWRTNMAALLAAGVRCFDIDASLVPLAAIPGEPRSGGHGNSGNMPMVVVMGTPADLKQRLQLHDGSHQRPFTFNNLCQLLRDVVRESARATPLLVALEPKFELAATLSALQEHIVGPLVAHELQGFVAIILTNHTLAMQVKAAAPAIRLAWPLRDRADCWPVASTALEQRAVAVAASSTGDGHTYPAAPAPALAANALLGLYDVLMPSVMCLPRPEVTSAITAWSSGKLAQRAEGATPPPPPPPVLAWIADDCDTATAAFVAGATRVVANNVTDLVHSCWPP
jgi:hypothetical protein